MPRSTANYLTTDANGGVGAEFAGHIKATGVELPADESLISPVPPTSAVEWKRTSDGARIAVVYGLTETPVGSQRQRTAILAATDFAGAGANFGHFPRLMASVTDVPASAVQAVTNGQARVLVDHNGKSSFLQTDMIRAFDGGNPATITVARPWTNIVGLFRSTGFLPAGSGMTSWVVSLDGYGTIANANFFWNTAGQHMPLVALCNVNNMPTQPATFTVRWAYSGFSGDVNDPYGGIVACW